MSRLGRAVAVMLACALAAACQVIGPATTDPARWVVALVGGRIQPAPDAPAIANGVVLVEAGVITTVGPSGSVPIPAGAVVLDPTDEYISMLAAGLSYGQILASLTTAPAERFGFAAKTGRIAKGMDADLTVVDGEPERDIRALARVRYTLRAGRVVFERKP